MTLNLGPVCTVAATFKATAKMSWNKRGGVSPCVACLPSGPERLAPELAKFMEMVFVLCIYLLCVGIDISYLDPPLVHFCRLLKAICCVVCPKKSLFLVVKSAASNSCQNVVGECRLWVGQSRLFVFILVSKNSTNRRNALRKTKNVFWCKRSRWPKQPKKSTLRRAQVYSI